MAAEKQQKRDSRILALILKGQLQASSSISDESGESILLADHPQFGQLLRLCRAIRSLEVTSNTSWWSSRESSFRAPLSQMPLWSALYRVSREHVTGFLSIHDGQRIKVIGISAGVVLTAHSNLTKEQCQEMLRHGDGTPAATPAPDSADVTAAISAAESKDQPFEWGAISTGLLAGEALLKALQQQSRQRLLDAFSWHSGNVAFHPDARASQLEGLVNLPLLALLRNGVWQKDSLSTNALREILKDLIGSPDNPKPLALLGPIGTLQYELTASESLVIRGATAGQDALQVLAAVEARRQGTEIHALRALYLFYELGLVGLALEAGTEQPTVMPLSQRPVPNTESPFHEETAPALQVSQGRLSGPNHLSEYRLQLELERDGRRLLREQQIDEAVSKFTQLVARQDRPTQALAYLAVATLLMRYPDKAKAVDFAKQALKNDSESALAHAALARALAAQGQTRPSEHHRTQALAIAQHNDTWFAEVESILSVGTQISAQQKPAHQRPLFAIVGLTAATLGGLFFLANVVPLGAKEYFYDGKDPFFFVRRGWLIFAGLLGVYLTRERSRGFLQNIGFSAPGGLLFLAVIWGIALGIVSPGQRVDASAALLVYLTVLHVISEELFFRAFLTGGLLRFFGRERWRISILVSAAIYGVYHLSYYSFWHETALFPQIYYCAGIGILAGGPYAWLYHKSSSIVPPVVCHLLVNTVMMLTSLL